MPLWPTLKKTLKGRSASMSVRKHLPHHERFDVSPDLMEYDTILLNSSAGKDSQVMSDYVCRLARERGVGHRVVMVHADLGRMEWEGTRELAELHALVYFNVPIYFVSREAGNLIDQIRKRGMWPDAKNRYCTSDQKRDQIAKLLTKLTDEWHAANPGANRRCRILNCMGIRSDESRARSLKKPFGVDERASNRTKREVTTWYPIFRWTEADVWASIHASGIPYHFAYDLGMPQLSCAFCVFASKAALMIAGIHNPELLDELVELENEIGHRFQNATALETIKQKIESGERPHTVDNWTM